MFAGGCFWCLEADFEKLPGVLAAESGYTVGHVPDPGYELVGSGMTGHAEAVRVSYDPARLGYADLLAYFWRHIDPTEADRQFCDAGSQYRSAIFYASEAERSAAEAMKTVRESLSHLHPIHLAPVSVAECTRAAITEAGLPTGVRVQVEHLDDLPHVVAGQHSLTMVFANLLGNALDAMRGVGNVGLGRYRGRRQGRQQRQQDDSDR